MILLVSLGLRNFKAIQRQSRLRFVWSGLGSICLTFFIFLSVMFVFKVSDAYSRGTLLFQLLTVACAISLYRVTAFNRFSAAISAGRVETSRLVVIGSSSASNRILQSLAQDGADIVRIFPFPIGHASEVSSAKKQIDLSKARDLVAACRGLNADDILMIPGEGEMGQASQLAPLFSELPVSVHVIPLLQADMFRRASVGELGNRHLTIQLMARPLSMFDRSHQARHLTSLWLRPPS